MRVVLDTNVLISSQFPKAGLPAAIVEAWRRGRFELLCHRLQIEELRDVAARPKFKGKLRRAEVGTLIKRINETAVMVDRLPSVTRSADPFDDFLLAKAEAGAADILVSGDGPGLLALGRHGATRILSPRAFADELRL